MKLPTFRKPASRPGPVARVKAAFSNLQVMSLVALAVGVLALVIAVIK